MFNCFLNTLAEKKFERYFYARSPDQGITISHRQSIFLERSLRRMFENVLTQEQITLAERLLPELEDFYLAGGTAIALQIGHRRSLDFDLASPKPIAPFDLERDFIKKGFKIEKVFTATTDEFSVLMDGTRVTFFSFPFAIKHDITWQRGKITIPDIIELGAMKAYALGRRNKWKDYVDLYFLLKNQFTLNDLIERAKKIFSNHFNSKLFREQMCYFEDIDYSEAVDYINTAPEDGEIKDFLESVAIKF